MKQNDKNLLTGSISELGFAKEFLASQNLNIVFPSKSLTRNETYNWFSTFYTLNPSATEVSVNRINDLDIRHLERKFTDRLINLIVTEDFEYGMTSKSELLVKEQLEQNKAATQIWLNSIFLKHFNSSEIIIGILRVISRFSEGAFTPVGQTMAIASLSHKNEEVVETAIRVFENWGGLRSVYVLENVSIKSSWLDDYRNSVIGDIKAELCLS